MLHAVRTTKEIMHDDDSVRLMSHVAHSHGGEGGEGLMQQR